MLLTDGIPNDDASLQAYESAILQVSATEMIPLSAKLSLALTEISQDVLDTLLDRGMPSDPHATTRQTIGVSDVVVTPQMTVWHAVHTLEVFYRDAFNNQLNNRYQAKVNEYHAALRRRAGQDLSVRHRGVVDSDSAGADAGSELRSGADSGDDLLRTGELGIGERAVRRSEQLDDLRFPHRQPAGGDGGKSSASGDGIQRVHGAVSGHGDVADLDAGCVGGQLYAACFRAGDGNEPGMRPDSGRLRQRRAVIEAGLSQSLSWE